ncbi:hypothetical protein D3C76_1613330 [compost metagenome]
MAPHPKFCQISDATSTERKVSVEVRKAIGVPPKVAIHLFTRPDDWEKRASIMP